MILFLFRLIFCLQACLACCRNNSSILQWNRSDIQPFLVCHCRNSYRLLFHLQLLPHAVFLLCRTPFWLYCLSGLLLFLQPFLLLQLYHTHIQLFQLLVLFGELICNVSTIKYILHTPQANIKIIHGDIY